MVETVISTLSLMPGLIYLRNYDKLLNPTILLFCIIYLLSIKSIRYDTFSIVSTLLIPYGIIIGLINGGDLRYIISHIFWGMMIPLIYLSAYNTNWTMSYLEIYTRNSTKVFVVLYCLSFLVFLLSYLFSMPLYPGINPAILLFALTIFLVKRKRLASFITILLILISGKRTFAVCAVVVLIAYLPYLNRKQLHSKLIIGSSIIMGVSLLIFSLLPTIGSYSSANFIGALASKWQVMNPFDDSFNYEISTSGRAYEIEVFLMNMGSNIYSWILGLGYGWYITLELATENVNFHYVHFTPLNFIAYYGVPLTCLFYYFLWNNFVKSYIWTLEITGHKSAAYALALFLLGAFTWSLFALSFATVPIIWFIFGQLASLQRRFSVDKMKFNKNIPNESNCNSRLD